MARYRGGGGIEMQTGESSMGSLLDGADDNDDDEDTDDDDDEDDNDEEESARRICLSSYDTKEDIIVAGDTETLPCGAIAAEAPISNEQNSTDSRPFQWTLSNWGSTQAHRRNNSGTVRVDLASPEDISLDTDNSSRVVFSAYGTTV